MSPQRIVETALERGLDAIAVTDHNSTLQCPEIQALGKERGLTVFAGAEVTTREEAHCVALFADDEARATFQAYLYEPSAACPERSRTFWRPGLGERPERDCGRSSLFAYFRP